MPENARLIVPIRLSACIYTSFRYAAVCMLYIFLLYAVRITLYNDCNDCMFFACTVNLRVDRLTDVFQL